MSLLLASFQGLTTYNTVMTAGACLLPLLLGIAVGSRMFVKVDKESFRNHVLILLIILAIAGLVRAIVA